jgi:hypothetical protein
VRGPGGRLGEGQELGPVWQGRKNLESSGERTGFIPREEDADPTRVEAVSAIIAVACDMTREGA